MAREAVSIEKRNVKLKSGIISYWYMRWYGTDGKYCSKSIGRTDKISKRQARKIAQAKQQEFENAPARRDKAKECTLKEYTDLYFKMREHELRPKTIEIHRQAANYLLEYFGPRKKLQNITRSNARAFQAAMAANKVKPREQAIKNDNDTKGRRNTTIGLTTVNMYMRAIRKMFSLAQEDHLILENPFSKIVTPVNTDTRWHYITYTEFIKMIEHSPTRFKLLISLCRLAGLRKSEATHLEWSDIDFEENRIHITSKDDWQPKTHSSLRTIPLCPELQTTLLEAYEQAQEGDIRVISGDTVNIDRDMKNIRKKAKVKLYSKPLHTLRKSCITDWAKRFPMHVAQNWAGHTKITTTAKYYSQVREDDFKMAAEMRHFERVCTQNDTQTENNEENQPEKEKPNSCKNK